MLRRIRIRSWKDVVVIVVIGVLYALLDMVGQKYFPQISQKTRRRILYILLIIVCVILLFAVGE
jgi:hypothetical protein